MQTIMKRSRQRDAILAYLNTRTDHPTAEMVYTALRQTIPNISLGTVYRNLSQLADCGQILRISCDGKADHFDAMAMPHPHFFCRQCGCVQDIPAALPFDPIPYVASQVQGQICSYSLIYYGTCDACLEQKTE